MIKRTLTADGARCYQADGVGMGDGGSFVNSLRAGRHSDTVDNNVKNASCVSEQPRGHARAHASGAGYGMADKDLDLANS